MATTYTLIKGETLATATSSYTFSSIPGIFTDLCLRVSTSLAATGSYFEQTFIQLNGVTSGYSATLLRSNGSTTGSNRDTANSYWNYFYTNDSSVTSNTFSGGEAYIPNYATTNQKVISMFTFAENNSATAGQSWIANAGGLLNLTSAITSVKVSAGSNFLAGSSFYLYGIKNS